MNEKENRSMGTHDSQQPEETKQFVLYFVYGLALVSVWGFLSAPTILYVMPKQTSCKAETSSLVATTEPPTELTEKQKMSRCEELNSSSVCAQYFGSRPSNLVYIAPNRTQEQTEADLDTFFTMMGLYATQACLVHGKPSELLCQIAYPHCKRDEKSGKEYGVPMCPSGCRRAENQFCQFEWTAAKAAAKMDPVTYGALKIQPCDILPDEADVVYGCEVNESLTIEAAALINTETNSNGSSSCPPPLVPSSLPDVPCSPKCGQWSWNSLGESDAITACTWVAFIVGILSSLVVFINWAGCQSLHNPSGLIILYINICAFVGCAVIGIGMTIGKKSAYCSAEDWATAFLKPTTFCTYQGAIYHFATLSMYMWWMFLLINRLLTLFSTDLSKAFEDRPVLIHAIESLIGWGIPLLLVGAAFIKDQDTAYGLQSTDPLACGPVDLSTGYFTLSLPLQVIFIVALTMVLIFFAVRDCKPTLIYWNGTQVKKIVAKPAGNLEKRYLILIASFPIMCLFFFAPQIPLMFNSKKLECDLTDYFICMTIKKDPALCPQDYRRYLYPVLFCIGALSMCVSSYALLFFVALSKESRKSWRRHKDSLHNFMVRVGLKIDQNRCDKCQCDIVDKEKKIVMFAAQKSEKDARGDEIGKRYAHLSDCKQCVTAF